MATVLVVDDEEPELALLAQLVKSAGHNCLVARSGREALDMLKEWCDVNAIITDLRMPEINGLRLIRERREAGDSIPIIAISGVNADQLILAEDYGANAVLPKPVDGQKLLQALEDILDRSKSSWADAWIHPEFGSVGDR
jgi:CheY-like chemotaxis protein